MSSSTDRSVSSAAAWSMSWLSTNSSSTCRRNASSSELPGWGTGIPDARICCSRLSSSDMRTTESPTTATTLSTRSSAPWAADGAGNPRAGSRQARSSRRSATGTVPRNGRAAGAAESATLEEAVFTKVLPVEVSSRLGDNLTTQPCGRLAFAACGHPTLRASGVAACGHPALRASGRAASNAADAGGGGAVAKRCTGALAERSRRWRQRGACRKYIYCSRSNPPRRTKT